MKTATAKKNRSSKTNGGTVRRTSQKTTRILAVESDRYARNFLSQMLGEFGVVKLVNGGPAVFETARKYKPNLVVVGLDENDLNGLCMCRWLKETHPDICIVLITNEDSSPEAIRDYGMVDGQIKTPIDSRELRSLLCQLLESQLRSRATRIEEKRYDRVKRSFSNTVRFADSLKTEDQTLASLLMFTEMKDQGAAHLTRVQAYAQCIATQLRESSAYADQITDKFLCDLQIASQLHDIGNIVVGDELNNQATELSDIEYETIKMHTHLGADLLKASAARSGERSTMEMAERIARCHHEYWDGNGYPNQLSKEDIPLEARIVAVADVYDALTSNRSFRDSFTPELARNVIQNESGKQFDPNVVDAFLETFDAIEVTGETINEMFERESDSGATDKSPSSEAESQQQNPTRTEKVMREYRDQQRELQSRFRGNMSDHLDRLKTAYFSGKHDGVEEVAGELRQSASIWGLTEATQCALELQDVIQRSESVEQVGIKLQQLLNSIEAE